MHEYIKRSDAIAEINRGDLLVGNNAEWAREIIWRTPHADVVEVKHGRWVHDDPWLFGFECDQCCKWILPEGTNGDMNYCPNCGAKMDE